MVGCGQTFSTSQAFEDHYLTSHNNIDGSSISAKEASSENTKSEGIRKRKFDEDDVAEMIEVMPLETTPKKLRGI